MKSQNEHKTTLTIGLPNGGNTKITQKPAKQVPENQRGSIPSPLRQGSQAFAVTRRPLFPLRSKVMRLNYYEDISLSSGASSVGNYVYSANGLYDPNITSTGHQPIGFDQMMLVYNHYTVLRSRISVLARNPSNTYASNVALSVNADSSTVTVAERLLENALLTTQCLAPKFNTGYLNRMSLPCNIRAFSGVDDLLDEHEYRGSSAANPVEQQYFHISCWNPDDAVVVQAALSVLIEYDVVFTEPKPLTQS